MNFSMKIISEGKTVHKFRTRSKRRFLKNIRTINWSENEFRVVARVYYGKYLDNFGVETHFFNEGVYKNKTDLLKAISAFIEK